MATAAGWGREAGAAAPRRWGLGSREAGSRHRSLSPTPHRSGRSRQPCHPAHSPAARLRLPRWLAGAGTPDAERPIAALGFGAPPAPAPAGTVPLAADRSTGRGRHRRVRPPGSTNSGPKASRRLAIPGTSTWPDDQFLRTSCDVFSEAAPRPASPGRRRFLCGLVPCRRPPSPCRASAPGLRVVGGGRCSYKSLLLLPHNAPPPL